MEKVICHHGIKGQRWGVRRFEDDNHKTQKNKKNLKTVAAVSGGIAVGASAVGLAWYLKNKKDIKIEHDKNVARALKAAATRKSNSEIFKSFRDVDVTIKKGSDFIEQFSNVKLAKLVLRG